MSERNNDLETGSMNKHIKDLSRGIKEFMKGYQLKTNLMKDENGDPLADSHNLGTDGRITSVSY
jgi:hypothetical protein